MDGALIEIKHLSRGPDGATLKAPLAHRFNSSVDGGQPGADCIRPRAAREVETRANRTTDSLGDAMNLIGGFVQLCDGARKSII